ncbi:hypothetical protein Nepgr_010452 [Nepenthes gracilis]|uniref:Uncharacterized protein n=1 Tax=Nepenthes gracilis TaxID=150966 RepID=A0AAD3SDF9_NEPGR|nr:hypothetical protein Nepgr_010452 [Nepenthes gracilis]
MAPPAEVLEQAHRNPQKLNSKKWVAKSLNQQPNCPQAPAHGPRSHVGVVVHPSDQVLVAEALVDASSALVNSYGLGLVLSSAAAVSKSKLAEAEVGSKGSSSGMEGNVDQLSQDGQALPCDAGAEVDTSEFGIYVDGSAPGVPTGSLKEGTSEEISSVAFISLTRDEGSSNLPELIADRDSDQSPCHQVTNSDDQIERFSDEAPSVEACNSSGVALNLAIL